MSYAHWHVFRNQDKSKEFPHDLPSSASILCPHPQQRGLLLGLISGRIRLEIFSTLLD